MAALTATIVDVATTAAANQKFLEALEKAKDAFTERGIAITVSVA